MSNLYDAVERHKSARRARSGSLKLPVLIALVLLAVAAYPIVSTVRAEHRYQYYTGSLTESVLYAGEHASMTTTLDGVSEPADEATVQQLYSLLIAAGKGTERKTVPEGEGLLVTFGDGSTLEAWYTDVRGAVNYSDCAAFRYTAPSGWQYCYETRFVRYSLLLIGVGR